MELFYIAQTVLLIHKPAMGVSHLCGRDLIRHTGHMNDRRFRVVKRVVNDLEACGGASPVDFGDQVGFVAQGAAFKAQRLDQSGEVELFQKGRKFLKCEPQIIATLVRGKPLAFAMLIS